jgi:hypothetical protein
MIFSPPPPKGKPKPPVSCAPFAGGRSFFHNGDRVNAFASR